jgi:hypothetical protein
MWPILALAWALAARKWGGEKVATLHKLWLIFFAIIGSHLFLDIMMSYRLYFAWPFTDARGSLDIMPFYDLYIFVGWLLLLAVNRWRKWPSVLTAKIGLLIFLVMFSVRTVGKLRTEQLAQTMMASHTSQVETRPTYYQPWILYARSVQTSNQWMPINILTGQRVSPDHIINRWFPPIRWRSFFHFRRR